jgi:antirestriction protein
MMTITTTSEQSTETPRIYVACLAAYNAGKLHGAWIDADRDADDIRKDIKSMLKKSPMAAIEVCEDWAIHDSEYFHEIEISEMESIDRVSEIAMNLAEHGAAYAVYVSRWDESIEDFEDRYRGCYESKEDFAYHLYAEMGTLKQLEEIGFNESYVDFETIARDLFIDDYTSVEKGYKECFVFSDR